MSVRASLAYFVTRGASGALAVATVALFARLLGPAGYAHWALAVTVSAFIAGVLIQPLHASLARYLPTPGFETLPGTLGRGVVLAAFAGLPIALVLELVAPGWLPPGIAFAALALGVAQGLFDFSAQFLSSTLQARRYGRLYILKSLLALGLGIAALKLGAGAWGVITAMVLSYLLATLVAARDAWQRVLSQRFDPAQLRAIRGYALPLGFALATGFLLQWSDRLILAAHVSPEQLGAYSASGDLAMQGFSLIFSAFYLAWFPRLITAWEHQRDEVDAMFTRYLRLTAAVLMPAAVGFMLVAGDLAQALLGADYRADAARVLPWFALAALLGGLRAYVIDFQLNLTQRMPLLSAIVGASALLAVGLNLWLVPRYGIDAAARVAVFAQAAGCVMSFVAGRGVLRLRLPARDLLGLLAGLALMTLVVSALPTGGWLSLGLRISLGGAVYGAVAIAFDLAGLRSAMRPLLLRTGLLRR